MEVRVTENGKLQSDLFTKPSAGNSILHYGSSHPASLVKSIPIGQYLQLKRICSSEEYFHRQAGELRKCLIKCGYSKNVLKKAYNKAPNSSQD